MADERTNPPEPASAQNQPLTASPHGRPTTAVTTGTRIIGTYEVEQLINTGGMGEVYRGRNIHNGEPVAIKIVLPHLANDEMIVQLFQKEAKVLGRLFHEAIVRYHVFTNDPEIGRPCIVMEFVEGTSMNEVVKRGAMPLEDVRILLRRLAGALDKAHTVGVVHRDLSPDNVILEDGQVSHAKIIDFGIAKSSMKGDATLLQGQFAGKFGYVAPEQLGAFGGMVDGRTDIYSLALMMVAVCQGRTLNMGRSIVEAVRARSGVPDLSGVYPEIRPLLEHMLEPNPDNRPATMAVVARLVDHPEEVPERAGPDDDNDDRTRIIQVPGSSPPPTSTTGIRTSARGPVVSGTSQQDMFVGVPGSATAAKVEEKKSSKGGLIAALVVLALAGGGAGAYFAGIFGAPEETDPQTTETETTTEPSGQTQTTETTEPSGGETTPTTTETTEAEPSGQTETTEAEPEPEPEAEPLDERGRQLAWLNAYQAGTCVFIAPQPASGDQLGLNVYATSLQPAAALLSAFRGEHGSEPAISTRIINEPQCPVVDYLSRLRGARALPATLSLDNGVEVVRSGEAVSGRIEGLAGRSVSLFLVNGSGAATNLKPWITTASDGSVSFTFTVNLTAGQEPAPQLLLAIATEEAVTRLDAVPNGVTARALIPFVQQQMDQARQEPVAAVTFFRLEQ